MIDKRKAKRDQIRTALCHDYRDELRTKANKNDQCYGLVFEEFPAWWQKQEKHWAYLKRQTVRHITKIESIFIQQVPNTLQRTFTRLA